MQVLYLFILSFFVAIMKDSLFYHFIWFGALPDIALLLLVTYALIKSKSNFVIAGLFIGLALDLLSGRWFGYHMMSLALCGLLLIEMDKRLYLDRPIALACAISGGMMIRSGLHVGLFYLSDAQVADLSLFFYEAAMYFYTLLFAATVYAVWRLLDIAWKSLDHSDGMTTIENYNRSDMP